MVAMSGGVDSSVAALLLKEAGFQPVGVTLRLWVDPDAEERASDEGRGCCSLQDISDARRVADILEIPFYVLNMKEAFNDKVVSYFVREYLEGRTPNPCIACNRYIKFSLLLQKARAMGIGFLATGHYARIVYDSEKDVYRLFRGLDSNKDQSYMLYTMNQEQLSSVLFPLGGYTKEEARELAGERGLQVAEKRDSQEICFIPDNDYRSFLEREQAGFSPGDILSTSGKKLGRHRGLPFYTIGQRKGLGLVSPRPLYVVEIDRRNNVLIVGEEEETYSQGLEAEDLSFVSGRAPLEPQEVMIKIRYRSPLVPATLYPPKTSPQKGEGGLTAASRVRVVFDRKQKAVTPGQSVVFYRGDEVLGGGIIASRL
ncbi:MAG TPA: tRNA 2-thiouridine(34) synthase MnmA [Firmicutes bacterium]|nr:tRNA 2-thiouridine(34) synthase MnmA [Bacillota bacterium]